MRDLLTRGVALTEKVLRNLNVYAVRGRGFQGENNGTRERLSVRTYTWRV